MATIDGIGLAEPSTITKSLAAALIQRNSSNTYQELMCIADPDSTTSSAVAKVTNTAPNSTAWGLGVRVIGGPSSAADLLARVNQGVGNSSLADRWLVNAANSSAADYHGVRLVDSSGTGYHGPTNPIPIALTDSSNAVVKAADSVNNAIRVNVVAGAAGGSTVVTVARTVGNSSAADYLPVRIVDSSGTGFLAPGNEYTDGSTYSSLTGPSLTFNNSSNNTMRQVGTAQPLPVQLRDSSGIGIVGSTGSPAIGVNAVTVRQVYPTMQSTTITITSTHSTAIYPLISSVASVRHKVYAYFVGSTHTNPSTLIFCSSASAAGFDHWAVNFGSGSSGVTGANLAVAPPGFIFAGVSANALNVKVEGGSSVTSTVVVRVAVSWFDEA